MSSQKGYVWDGKGNLVLSQARVKDIFFDLLMVVAVNGSTTRSLDYHAGESVLYSGDNVQRKLTDITSILGAGKNQVTLYAKDTIGIKI